MKNKIMKFLARTIAFGLAFAVLALAISKPSWAANSQDAQSAFYDQTANGGYVTGAMATPSQIYYSSNTSNMSLAMNLFYTGSSTAAFASIASGGSNSSNCITFYAPYNVVDTSIGSATCGLSGGTFDLGVSTSNTMGQLCDLINGVASGGTQSNYHCKLLGAIRNDLATVTLSTITEQSSGINALNNVGGYNVTIGTSTIMSFGITPTQGRRVILEQCQVNSAYTTISVYGRKRGYSSGYDQSGNVVSDSNLSAQQVISANTLSYLPSQYTVYPWVEFAPNLGNVGTVPSSNVNASGAFRPYTTPVGQIVYDGHVVVRAGVAGGSAGSGLLPNGGSPQSSSNYIQCSWIER